MSKLGGVHQGVFLPSSPGPQGIKTFFCSETQNMSCSLPASLSPYACTIEAGAGRDKVTPQTRHNFCLKVQNLIILLNMKDFLKIHPRTGIIIMSETMET